MKDSITLKAAPKAAGSPRPSPESKPREALSPPSPAPTRLIALDAFRGLAVAGMLLVNNKALGPWTPEQLTHAGWDDGAHLADLVFPWFLLILGVAIPYSAASHWSKRLPAWSYLVKVLRRAAMLVLLGCLINSSYARHPMFDFGVLQQIGCAYGIAALLYPVALRYRLGMAGAFLLAHWALLRFLPIPGLGSGVFTREQNAIVYLNQAYLARYELENLPALLPTSALALIGTALGDLLRAVQLDQRRKVRALVVVGLVLVVAGWLWSLDLPLNKRVWTAPFILFAAGWGSATLGLLYLVVDVKGRRAWAFPLVVFGTNAITAFVAPILVNIYILNSWGWRLADGSFLSLKQSLLRFSTGIAGTGPGGLLYTTCYILFWWLVIFQMHRRGVHLKV